jgi:glycerate kinase
MTAHPTDAEQRSKVLVAPDSFKGTMSAATVAAALAEGVTASGLEAVVQILGDGGEGTAEALRAAWGGHDVPVATTDPLGRSIVASYLLAQGGRTAVVEAAAASGITFIADGERSPETASDATTWGTGELLAAAARSGAHEILLAVGGSATTDGGLGALLAIAENGGLRGVPVTVLSDVTTVFEDAARIYGPQKGADQLTVERLTGLPSSWPRDPRGLSRTGAAGGLAGAMWALHEARLVSGIDHVLDIVNIDQTLATATGVITGEGRLDAQTRNGKVVWGLSQRAQQHGIPMWAVTSEVQATLDEVHILGLAGAVQAGNPEALARAGRRIAASLAVVSPGSGSSAPAQC